MGEQQALNQQRARFFFFQSRNPTSKKSAVAQAFTPVKIRVPFWRYVEETANIHLDHWQVHLCNRLEKLVNQTGQRLMIHKPPQLGGSIIVAQRLTPYLLGHRPDYRCKVACYNIERATRHTRIAKLIINSEAHNRYFPEIGGDVRPTSPDKEWSTNARIAKLDSQPSFHALGLDSGFTGDGADVLLCDDPYSSAADARSKAINKRVCDFYPETAKPRLNAKTNVVMMFHRYTEDDIAGTTLADKSEGGWEYLRYAAIADGDYEHPVTEQVWADPLGRQPGEKLSERMPDSWYQSNQGNSYIWLSQFQGRPTNKEGNFFKVGLLTKDDFIDRNALPASLKRFTRGWDLAATEGGGDYTAGVLVAGPDENGYFYVIDCVRGQWGPDNVTKALRETAGNDAAFRKGVHQKLPQDPAQAGKWQAKALVKLLTGYRVSTISVSGDKETNAFDVSSQFNAGNIKIIKGAWNKDFLEELRAFPNGSNDDQVDGLSMAFNDLCGRKEWKTA